MAGTGGGDNKLTSFYKHVLYKMTMNLKLILKTTPAPVPAYPTTLSTEAVNFDQLDSVKFNDF